MSGWLVVTLAQKSFLDLTHADARSQMAEAIIEALPGEVLVECVMESMRATFAARGIKIDDDSLTQAARNAAQSILLSLGGDS